VDEGNNWINMTYGPLSLSRPVAGNGSFSAEPIVASAPVAAAGGAYTLVEGSAAIDAGSDATPSRGRRQTKPVLRFSSQSAHRCMQSPVFLRTLRRGKAFAMQGDRRFTQRSFQTGRAIRMGRKNGKMHKVAVYFRDYKTEHALTTPRLQETAIEGVKQTYKMNITQVAVHEPLDDSLFQRPQLAALATPTPKKP